MPGSPTGSLQPVADWRSWSPPQVIQPIVPQFSKSGRPRGQSLVTRLDDAKSLGKWTACYPVSPGGWYEFLVEADSGGGAELEPNSASVVVSWRESTDGTFPVARDYLEPFDRAGEAGRIAFARQLHAPDAARFAEVELVLSWQRGARVTWERVTVEKAEPPKPRVVRVATTRILPAGEATKEKNTALMLEMLDKLERHEPDLVLFSENLLDRSVSAPLAETAEPIPGPLFKTLSKRARTMKAYVATTIHERDGGHIYNTGFIVGRDGELVGKYRKVHLTMREAETGILPGTEYPVFDLDFGKVGMTTCWDNWFLEPSRILRLKGAEVLLFPLAGDGDPRHWDVLWRARAMDNGMYVVSSSTVGEGEGAAPSRIVSPAGDVLAETRDRHGFAIAELDLGRRYTTFWLSVGPAEGEARSLYVRERRPPTYGRLSGR